MFISCYTLMREKVNMGHNLFRQFFSAKRIREIDLLVHYPGTQQKRLEKLKKDGYVVGWYHWKQAFDTKMEFNRRHLEGCPIYTNWHDRYWVMFFFARPVRLVRLVRVVKQWFTSRSIGELYIIRGIWWVYWCPRPVRLVRLVRAVKQWFTSCSFGELYIIRET